MKKPGPNVETVEKGRKKKRKDFKKKKEAKSKVKRFSQNVCNILRKARSVIKSSNRKRKMQQKQFEKEQTRRKI